MPTPGGSPFKLKKKEDTIHIYVETYKTYSNGYLYSKKNNPDNYDFN
jgi:hypothetical protein